MKGLMMTDSLLVTRIIDYAARWHSEQVRYDSIINQVHCLSQSPALAVRLCNVIRQHGAGSHLPDVRRPDITLHLGRCAATSAPVLSGASAAGCAVCIPWNRRCLSVLLTSPPVTNVLPGLSLCVYLSYLVRRTLQKPVVLIVRVCALSQRSAAPRGLLFVRVRSAQQA